MEPPRFPSATLVSCGTNSADQLPEASVNRYTFSLSAVTVEPLANGCPSLVKAAGSSVWTKRTRSPDVPSRTSTGSGGTNAADQRPEASVSRYTLSFSAVTVSPLAKGRLFLVYPPACVVLSVMESPLSPSATVTVWGRNGGGAGGAPLPPELQPAKKMASKIEQRLA